MPKKTAPRPIVDATPDVLKEFLIEHGLTHKQLAEWLGVQEFSVTRWANAYGPIKHPRLVGLALEATAARLRA